MNETINSLNLQGRRLLKEWYHRSKDQLALNDMLALIFLAAQGEDGEIPPSPILDRETIRTFTEALFNPSGEQALMESLLKNFQTEDLVMPTSKEQMLKDNWPEEVISQMVGSADRDRLPWNQTVAQD